MVAVSRGFVGVCTARTKRARTWFARKSMPPSAKTDYFSFGEMRAAMRLGLVRRTTKLGPDDSPVFFTQCRGVPIGGLWSAAAATTTLGGAEAVWSRSDSVRSRHNFDFHGLPWNQVVGCCRYVDDRLSVTRMLCPQCLNTAIEIIYPDSCKFDDSGVEPDGSVHWLDLKVARSSCGTTLNFTPKPIEPDWISGRQAESVKWHLPPATAGGGASITELRSLAAGRLARLAQIGMSDVEKSNTIQQDLVVWRKHGYSLHIIRLSWCGTRHCDFYIKTIMLYWLTRFC